MNAIKKTSASLAKEILLLNHFSESEIADKIERYLMVNYMDLFNLFQTKEEIKYEKLLKEQHKHFGENGAKYIELGFLVQEAKMNLKKINVSKTELSKASELATSRKKYKILKQFIQDKYGHDVLVGYHSHERELLIQNEKR